MEHGDHQFDPWSFMDAEDRIKAMRYAGLDVCDRSGRPLVPVYGAGPNAALARATHRLRQPAPAQVSEFLTRRDFWSGYEAVAFANLTGVVLNAMLTVSWGSVRCEGAAAWRADRKFRGLLRSRFRDWHVPQAWIYARESGVRAGDHTHLLLHVPHVREYDLAKWAEDAFKSASGAPALVPETASELRSVDLSLFRGDGVAEQWRVFKYIFKGLDRDELEFLLPGKHGRLPTAHLAGLRPKRQGQVVGRRAGVSRSLHEAERGCAMYPDGSPVWPPPQELLPDAAPQYDDRFVLYGANRRFVHRLGI